MFGVNLVDLFCCLQTAIDIKGLKGKGLKDQIYNFLSRFGTPFMWCAHHFDCFIYLS